jgi:hypothetical protein
MIEITATPKARYVKETALNIDDWIKSELLFDYCAMGFRIASEQDTNWKQFNCNKLGSLREAANKLYGDNVRSKAATIFDKLLYDDRTSKEFIDYINADSDNMNFDICSKLLDVIYDESNQELEYTVDKICFDLANNKERSYYA